MPIGGWPDVKLPPPDDRATLDRMPGSAIPVIRQPFQAGDLLPYWASTRPMETLLFDRIEDPAESHNLANDSSVAGDAEEMLRVALQSVEAPDDQFVRLGLD